MNSWTAPTTTTTVTTTTTPTTHTTTTTTITTSNASSSAAAAAAVDAAAARWLLLHIDPAASVAVDAAPSAASAIRADAAASSALAASAPLDAAVVDVAAAAEIEQSLQQQHAARDVEAIQQLIEQEEQAQDEEDLAVHSVAQDSAFAAQDADVPGMPVRDSCRVRTWCLRPHPFSVNHNNNIYNTNNHSNSTINLCTYVDDAALGQSQRLAQAAAEAASVAVACPAVAVLPMAAVMPAGCSEAASVAREVHDAEIAADVGRERSRSRDAEAADSGDSAGDAYEALDISAEVEAVAGVSASRADQAADAGAGESEVVCVCVSNDTHLDELFEASSSPAPLTSEPTEIPVPSNVDDTESADDDAEFKRRRRHDVADVTEGGKTLCSES